MPTTCWRWRTAASTTSIWSRRRTTPSHSRVFWKRSSRACTFRSSGTAAATSALRRCAGWTGWWTSTCPTSSMPLPRWLVLFPALRTIRKRRKRHLPRCTDRSAACSSRRMVPCCGAESWCGIWFCRAAGGIPAPYWGGLPDCSPCGISAYRL